MKKTYITPASLSVELGSRDAMMGMSASGEGIGYGGGTGEGGIIEGDVKEHKNVWDEEW